jgi:hypothetical protein
MGDKAGVIRERWSGFRVGYRFIVAKALPVESPDSPETWPYNGSVLNASATVRIRPLRFGFLLDPKDRVILRQVLQMNTCLWGRIYNYLLPVPKRTPARYQDYYFADSGSLNLALMKGTGPSAQQLVQGLLETFQPDLIVETKPGLAQQIPFNKDRIISLDQFNAVDERGRRKYGIDLRTVCAALYEEQFRFVQRHPPRVIEPVSSEKRYGLLFAAAFGEFPARGNLAGCRQDFCGALDAKDERLKPEEFHELFAPNTVYPLRVGAYELTTHRRGWSPNPMLFFMDEGEPWDIIEYWNLRAIGWRIRPLPQSLASKLTGYCEKFIAEAHRPYPPPSNACEDANFVCSRSCAFAEMQSYVSTLRRPNSYHVSIDPRFPRLWDEWGRRADHAEPHVVEHRTESTDAFSLGNFLSVTTILPEFAQKHPALTPEHACTNVLERLPGGATVVPWHMIDTSFFGGHLRDESIWFSREGICTTSGAHPSSRHMRLPSSLNVFAAWAQKNGLEISISPAGRVAEQLISAVGGLQGVRMIGNEELIRVFDRMANGTLEVEVSGDDQSESERRRRRKASIPLWQIGQLLSRANKGDAYVAENHLSALLRSNVLILGMEVPCSECGQTNWLALDQLDTKLKCNRCLREFDFPLTKPHKNTWSYRVQGPFAVEDYAHGAYSVAAALQFLIDEVSSECTWISSFRLHAKSGSLINAEADFGAFVRPTGFGELTDPLLIFGECKTFGDFGPRDYQRMRTLARLFPGAVISFCTLKNELTSKEKATIAALARQGRRSLKTGQRRNPVLVLTRAELLGQFNLERFVDDYPSQVSKFAEAVFMRRDLQEICDFTQQTHLGIESYYDWLERRRRKRAAKVATISHQQTRAAGGS